MKNRNHVILPFLTLLTSSLLLQNNLANASSSEDTYHHRFTIVGLLDFYNPSVDTNNLQFSSLTSGSKLSTGLGVISESSMMGPLDFELGLLILHRQSIYSSSVFKYTESSNWLTVPLGIKVRFAELFAVGVGPYFSYRVGEVSHNFEMGSTAALNFDTTNQERFEMGVQASADLTLPISANIGILIEARILKGLSNLSAENNTTIKSLDLMGVAGLQFTY